MLDQLCDRFAARLAHHHVAVLTTTGGDEAWAIPVFYQCSRLDICCLVPHWAGAVYYLEQDPQVLLIVQPQPDSPLCWLQYRGQARPLALGDWPGPWPEGVPPAEGRVRYQILSITPLRLDWIDERQGWGVRETLEIDSESATKSGGKQ